jgi:hypothetical protein
LQALGDVPATALSNDVRVPDADVSGSATRTPQSEGGVLANLPRTRPQRSSARRAAARGGAAGPARARKAAAGKPARPATKRPSATRAKPHAKARATQKRTVEAVSESSAAATAKASTPRPSSAVRAKRARTAKRATPLRPTEPLEPAPSQGFECDSEAEGAVQPPGGPELVVAAAEIVGELAKAGLSTGERLLKDVFSRFSPS